MTDEDQKPPDSNGWFTGKDPVLRPLRVVATITCLAVFGYLAVSLSVNEGANPTTVVPTLALALAAALLLLGYDDTILPGIGRRKDK